jgi:hypothetical protein
VRQGDARKRLDTDYHHPDFAAYRRRIAAVHERARLGDLVSAPLVTGFAAGKEDQTDAGGDAVPQLRPTNILPDGEISFDDVKHIPPASVHPGDLLADGEVLFNNTNSTAWVGKSALFRLGGRPAVCSNHITRIRPNARVSGAFLAEVLNMMQRARYFGRLATNFNNQAGINGETLADVQVPLGAAEKRPMLLAALDAARAARREKLGQANALLAGLDDFVLNTLGLTLPAPDGRSVYAVRLRDARLRLDPDYFHPERINAIRAVESRYTGDRATTLLGIADFVRDQRIVEPGDDYLGLANVQPNTGERIDSNEEDGKGNCFRYADGDVLFARLRPYLNKVYRAESDGVCSTEFHVIRIRRDEKGQPRVIPDYLAAVMRSSLVLLQTRHMMTGNTHPRLANDDVVNLVVPIPDANLQEKIAAEVVHRREKARRLRDEAHTIWDDAKSRFEKELLGPETSTEEPKTDRAEGGRRQ